MNQQQIEQIIIDILNTDPIFNEKVRLQKLEPSTPLFGSQGILDSLGLVHLTISLEERLAELTSKTVTLANDQAMSRRFSPFRSIEALARYASDLFAAESA